MHIEQFRDHCIRKKGITEEFPFGNETLVFKVMGKLFALAGIDTFESINLKCDPEEAVQLREKYDAVQPGYHMNKKHWNTVILDGSLPDKLVFKMIDDSYNLIAAGLAKAEKKALEEL